MRPTYLRTELCTFNHFDTLRGEHTYAEVLCVVSIVHTGAGVKVVRTNGAVVRMVLVCAVMYRYILASSLAEFENGGLVSVSSKDSFTRARKAVKSSRVIVRNEGSESSSTSFVT